MMGPRRGAMRAARIWLALSLWAFALTSASSPRPPIRARSSAKLLHQVDQRTTPHLPESILLKLSVYHGQHTPPRDWVVLLHHVAAWLPPQVPVVHWAGGPGLPRRTQYLAAPRSRCAYQGHVVGHDHSIVVMELCGGQVHGQLTFGNNMTFHIEHKSNEGLPDRSQRFLSSFSDHYVSSSNMVWSWPPASSPIAVRLAKKQLGARRFRHSPRKGFSPLSGSTVRYPHVLELVLAADHSFVTSWPQLGNLFEMTVTYLMNIAVLLDRFLRTAPGIGLRSVLKSIVIVDSSQVQPSKSAADYLSRLRSWGYNHRSGVLARDAMLLLAGAGFSGSSRGTGTINTDFCKDSDMYSVVAPWLDLTSVGSPVNVAQTTQVAAHELLHNFGVQHADPECSSPDYIMTSVIGVGQTKWSNCTLDVLRQNVPIAPCLQHQVSSSAATCTSGYYRASGADTENGAPAENCRPCRSNCSQCIGAADNCTSCTPPYALQGSVCVPSCIHGYRALQLGMEFEGHGLVCQPCPVTAGLVCANNEVEHCNSSSSLGCLPTQSLAPLPAPQCSPSCNSTAGSEAECIGDNVCACGMGFSGLSCNATATIPCPYDCGANGVCNLSTVQCDCTPPYHGPSCELLGPTSAPTPSPTLAPSASPTTAPPSLPPTQMPTASPTTAAPSIPPTLVPTVAPTLFPTQWPTTTPGAPTDVPTPHPTAAPSSQPTVTPTVSPSTQPTLTPTAPTTRTRTAAPTRAPTTNITVAVGGAGSDDNGSGPVDSLVLPLAGVGAVLCCCCAVTLWRFRCNRSSLVTKQTLVSPRPGVHKRTSSVTTLGDGDIALDSTNESTEEDEVGSSPSTARSFDHTTDGMLDFRSRTSSLLVPARGVSAVLRRPQRLRPSLEQMVEAPELEADDSSGSQQQPKRTSSSMSDASASSSRWPTTPSHVLTVSPSPLAMTPVAFGRHQSSTERSPTEVDLARSQSASSIVLGVADQGGNVLRPTALFPSRSATKRRAYVWARAADPVLEGPETSPIGAARGPFSVVEEDTDASPSQVMATKTKKKRRKKKSKKKQKPVGNQTLTRSTVEAWSRSSSTGPRPVRRSKSRPSHPQSAVPPGRKSQGKKKKGKKKKPRRKKAATMRL